MGDKSKKEILGMERSSFIILSGIAVGGVLLVGPVISAIKSKQVLIEKNKRDAAQSGTEEARDRECARQANKQADKYMKNQSWLGDLFTSDSKTREAAYNRAFKRCKKLKG